MAYVVVNPTDYSVDVTIEQEGTGKRESLPVQPKGRPRLPDGFRVLEECLKLNPRIKVYEVE
jgi:hypothetical protein